MNGYEKEYHLALHSYLYSSKEYYDARAKLAYLKYFKGVSKSSKVLEFGCGLGQNIYLIPNAWGYDISKFSLNFAKSKGINATDNLKKIKDSSFDVVISCHVLEHLENPLEALKLMKQKLKKGGKLILVLPVEKQQRVEMKMDSSQHLYCWNFRTINNLLIKAGFRPIENSYLRGAGYKKLLPISRISFKLYDFLTRFLSFLTCEKDMKIIALKK